MQRDVGHLRFWPFLRVFSPVPVSMRPSLVHSRLDYHSFHVRPTQDSAFRFPISAGQRGALSTSATTLRSGATPATFVCGARSIVSFSNQNHSSRRRVNLGLCGASVNPPTRSSGAAARRATERPNDVRQNSDSARRRSFDSFEERQRRGSPFIPPGEKRNSAARD